MVQLKDELAIVAGAGKRIGKPISRASLSQGTEIIMVTRSLSLLEKTAEGIRSRKGKALAIRTCVASEEQIQ